MNPFTNASTPYERIAMTLPKLSTMNTRQVLNLVASFVGWVFESDGLWHWRDNEPDFPGELIYAELPDFLHDERAAITLCKGYRVVTVHHRESDTWTASFIEDEDTSWTSQPSPSLATAITHAFCLANNLAEL